MAFSISHFALSFPLITSQKSTTFKSLKPTRIFTKQTPKLASKSTASIKTRASQEQGKTTNDPESEPAKNPSENQQENVDIQNANEISELGNEINKAMKEREQKEPDFWSGVAEEINEIEWPAFNKVLGTTGVVLGVIAGSSVVLLTVNAILAELSDKVFAGKGVQDFLG